MRRWSIWVALRSNRPRPRPPDFASLFRLREATSGKPGGYVEQAVLDVLGGAGKTSRT